MCLRILVMNRYLACGFLNDSLFDAVHVLRIDGLIILPSFWCKWHYSPSLKLIVCLQITASVTGMYTAEEVSTRSPVLSNSICVISLACSGLTSYSIRVIVP